MKSLIMAAIAALFFASLATTGYAEAMSNKQNTDQCHWTNEGRVICMGLTGHAQIGRSYTKRQVVKHRSSRHRVAYDANGNSVVRSSRGVSIRVAPSARAALQCVVDYVEAAGVRITAMRGYGVGTVRSSLHPSGRALDINQTGRDITSPAVPRSISNAAADKCGVISGARWGYADNGHWNLAIHGRASQEPWPRVIPSHRPNS